MHFTPFFVLQLRRIDADGGKPRKSSAKTFEVIPKRLFVRNIGAAVAKVVNPESSDLITFVAYFDGFIERIFKIAAEIPIMIDMLTKRNVSEVMKC